MKLFLGADTSELKTDLKKLKINLNKGKNFEYQWIPENQRHILLSSLGEVSSAEFDVMDSKLLSLTSKFPQFKLKFEGMSAYPDSGQARLIWIGVQHSKDLRELYQLIVDDLGLKPESEFRPVLPVVRLRNHREVSDILSPHRNTDFGKLIISNLVVYEMTSTGAFPTYNKLKEYLLKNLSD